MKILHINSYYNTSKFYKNLYDNQIKMGLDIDVFVPVTSSFKISDFDYGKYTIISRNHNKYDRIFFHVKHNKIYNDIQNKYNIKEYSVIHAHSLFSNGFIAMKLKRKYGIPYVVAVRNTDVNIFFNKMIHLRRIGIEILKEADQIIFLSKSYEKQVIDKYVPKILKETIQSKVSIVPNGIDNFWFDNTYSQKREINISEIRILQIGDINKNKNIVTTIKAIDLLYQKGYKVKLDVVGKIKDQRIFNKIKNLSYVNYLGYKSKEELIEIYRNNDIFILPSITETFGLVYPEAMSQGLPVIYSKGQGFDGQFEDEEVGYSVDCCNEIDISNTIINILNNFNEISVKCIKDIGKFNWENISLQYAKLYKRITKG